jgi:NitT/TauT family transport system ATP-binding protein
VTILDPHLDPPLGPASAGDAATDIGRGVAAPVPAVRIADVSKQFGSGPSAVLALDRVSLDVERGEFLCIVGASGCGKSTLLNLVAGLDAPSAGTVTAQGRVALMFQEAALLPWRTAAQNVELALKFRKVPRAERRAQALDLLSLVRLQDFADKRPHELSGGMRQRVALARALGQGADVLLMDEPFGALDAITRDVLHDEVERVAAEQQLTTIFVTHNVGEAARLGDRIVLLSSRPGRVAAEFGVPVERPRRIESPEVSSIAADVTVRLREEVRRHAG